MLRMAGALLGAAVLVLAASPARATFPYPAPPPGTPPQDYAAYLRLPSRCRRSVPSTSPAAPSGSSPATRPAIPPIDANPAELFGVRGMSVDLAWQVTTGRPDVLIAVLDSGIKWDDVGAMRDLRAQGAPEPSRAAAAARCRRAHQARVVHRRRVPESRTRTI